jgi:hypothetical protein
MEVTMFAASFRLAVSTVVLLAVVISAACGGSATPPTSPTPVPQTATTRTPPPPTRPEPSTGLTPFAGVWELTLRLTDTDNTVYDDRSGCVADALRAEVGVPRDYLLTVTENDVTITNPAKNLACTFETVKGNSEGFSTVGVLGVFRCTRQWALAVRCGDQTTYDFMSFGQDISARVTGTEIAGEWFADWFEDRRHIGFSTKAEFKGRRQ